MSPLVSMSKDEYAAYSRLARLVDDLRAEINKRDALIEELQREIELLNQRLTITVSNFRDTLGGR